MNILITGSNGYLGSILVRKLMQAKSRYYSLIKNNKNVELNNGHLINYDKIYLYDNLMYKQLSLIDCLYNEDIEFIHGDVRDQNKLKKYIEKSDIIIPLAAIVGMPACNKDQKLAEDINYKQIKFICNNANNKKIIIPTTNSMYGTSTEIITEESIINPLSLYAQTKVDAEKEVINYGGISLRLATLFGISQKMRLDLLVNSFTYKAMTDKYLVLFEKDFVRNYLHVQDASIAFIHFINNYDKYNGQIFNAGLSSSNLTKYELALKIKEYIDYSIQIDDISSDPDKRNYIISNNKIEKTGWLPYYTVDNGIKELIKAYNIIINFNNFNFTNL